MMDYVHSPSLRRQRMSRASSRIWQNWVAGMGMVVLVFLGGWWWRATVVLQYDAQDGREDLAVAASRVARGGSSSSPPEGLTSTSREIISAIRQTTGHAYIGFRCVKPLEMLSQATALQGR